MNSNAHAIACLSRTYDSVDPRSPGVRSWDATSRKREGHASDVSEVPMPAAGRRGTGGRREPPPGNARPLDESRRSEGDRGAAPSVGRRRVIGRRSIRPERPAASTRWRFRDARQSRATAQPNSRFPGPGPSLSLSLSLIRQPPRDADGARGRRLFPPPEKPSAARAPGNHRWARKSPIPLQGCS